MNYEVFSANLIEQVGGIWNIERTSCCFTRLRLVLVDESKANDEAVKQIEGVKGLIKRAGQYQIVIGVGVEKLLQEFDKFIAKERDGL